MYLSIQLSHGRLDISGAKDKKGMHTKSKKYAHKIKRVQVQKRIMNVV